jgi:hypothetical protein
MSVAAYLRVHVRDVERYALINSFLLFLGDSVIIFQSYKFLMLSKFKTGLSILRIEQ